MIRRFLLVLFLTLLSGLALAQDGDDQPPKEGLPRPSEVFETVDAALRVLKSGDRDAAYAQLDEINSITYANDYAPLSKHYPNLGLAYYYLDLEDWDDVQFFAASVATGLTADGFGDHDNRLRASILQGVALHRLGRDHEAEIVLRNAVDMVRERPALGPEYGLGLFALARVATLLNLPDEAALRHAFLNEYETRWLVPIEDAVHIS